MATFLKQPLRGWWGLSTFPEVIELDGVRFRRAIWRQTYPGVVAQYREDKSGSSRHLMVNADGTWSIDHVDAVNPDHGPVDAVLHFLIDHPVGNLAALGLGIMAIGSALKD